MDGRTNAILSASKKPMEIELTNQLYASFIFKNMFSSYTSETNTITSDRYDGFNITLATDEYMEFNGNIFRNVKGSDITIYAIQFRSSTVTYRYILSPADFETMKSVAQSAIELYLSYTNLDNVTVLLTGFSSYLKDPIYFKVKIESGTCTILDIQMPDVVYSTLDSSSNISMNFYSNLKIL